MALGKYVPTTTTEQAEMLQAIGLTSLQDLYVNVPQELMIEQLQIPQGQSELEVRRLLTKLARQNQVFESIFRGAGAYHHYIPSLVKQIASKEEFLTAYTPYQAEISQGVLQAIFEFQTMICELTGMAVANASVYDGATAAAEAVNMTIDRKRRHVLVAATAHPMTIETIRTYCQAQDIELQVIPALAGKLDLVALEAALGSKTACLYVQQPNYFGQIEEAAEIGALVHAVEAQYILGVNPMTVSILKTPAEFGADIVTGEAQPLGLPLAFGGPYLGFMATTEKLTRKLPGRIAGETVDAAGERAFVLTLQAREQHIRREKSSSNICSNQAHCALTASIYLSVMGPRGLQEVAQQSYAKAHYLSQSLTELPGFELVHPGEFFHEFVTTTALPAEELMAALAERGILGGYPVAEGILWCVTEMNTQAEMDHLVATIKEVIKR